MSRSCPDRFAGRAEEQGPRCLLGAGALCRSGSNVLQRELLAVLRLLLIYVFALCVVLWVRPAWAADQPVSAGSRNGDPFAMYHADLERAANEVVARADAGTALGAAQRSASTAGPREPEVDRLVDRFAAQYWGDKARDLRSALARLQQLRPALSPILRSERIPTELIAVVLVESAANPSALSVRGARGLWQLIPETARRYGLRVEPGRDERLDTERATRAAARYLADLHDRFGDWLLALAAYNAGEDRVESAIEHAGRADFSLLSARRLLPAETRNYVPAVISAAEMISGRNDLSFSASDRAHTPLRTVYAKAAGD